MILNKEELIDRLFHKLVASNTRYPKWELKNIIDPFIEVLNEALSEGNEIRIRNFGKFTIRAKKGRRFYNVQTGKMDTTSDTKSITFIPSRFLNFETSTSHQNTYY